MINIRKLETELWEAADLLRELLQIFNNSAFNEMKDNVVGRIYKYSYQAGVSLHSVQMYEQRNKDINKAQMGTVNSLLRVLGCKMEDLMEY